MEQQGGIPLPLSDGSLSPENTQPCSPDGENMDKSLERRTSIASITSSVQVPYVIPDLVKADLYVISYITYMNYTKTCVDQC